MCKFFQDKTAFILFLLWIGLSLPLAAELEYDVEFIGIPHSEITKIIESSSSLVTLKDKPPASTVALHRRADAEIPHFLNIMRSFAYYDAKVKIDIDNDVSPIKVQVTIDPGPLYTLGAYKIVPFIAEEEAPPEEEQEQASVPPTEESQYLANIPLECLHLRIGMPALAEKIMQAAETLINFLNEAGYPLASAEDEEILVDQESKTLQVTLYIDRGPRALFGPVSFKGLKKVNEKFIRDEIYWCEGDYFDLRKIRATESTLLASELFSFVRITWGDEVDECNRLPLTIEVKEARFRSIAGGISVTTQLGPGINFEWEHRNIDHLGRRLTFEAEIWGLRQNAVLAYRQPNFRSANQDLVWIAEVEHTKTTGYIDSSASLSNIVEKTLNDHSTFYYGWTIKELKSSQSDHLHGNFTLLQVPLQYAWSNVNNALNPTYGCSLNLKVNPTVQVRRPSFEYVSSLMTLIFYDSFGYEDSFVLATKAVIGSIVGASRRSIPAPERFYSGNENTLRGYKYLTVSPLGDDFDKDKDRDKTPIGGRSILVFSIEARSHFTDTLGSVLFYEIGNVFSEPSPPLNKKFLQSAGIGLRYFTAVGPIRFDVAVPLDRRRGLDPAFQIYFSIGQAF